MVHVASIYLFPLSLTLTPINTLLKLPSVTNHHHPSYYRHHKRCRHSHTQEYLALDPSPRPSPARRRTLHIQDPRLPNQQCTGSRRDDMIGRQIAATARVVEKSYESHDKDHGQAI